MVETDDFARTGVRFVRPPKREDYGTVAVFDDLPLAAVPPFETGADSS